MKRLDHLIQSIQQMDDAPAMGQADLVLYAPCPVKLVVIQWKCSRLRDKMPRCRLAARGMLFVWM